MWFRKKSTPKHLEKPIHINAACLFLHDIGGLFFFHFNFNDITFSYGNYCSPKY
jgi:hypothetical protein